MKKVGDLFSDLGFNKDAPRDVQVAFLKNLIGQAQANGFRKKKQLKEWQRQIDQKYLNQVSISNPSPEVGEQLSFDFSACSSNEDKRVC